MVPVFSGPRDERPSTMYGHFSEVPIDFQRICPSDQRTPTERGRGQFLKIIIPLQKRTLIPCVFFFKINNILFLYTIFLKMASHISCTAQCMLGVLFLSNLKRPRATRASSTHSCFTFRFTLCSLSTRI